MSVYADKDFKKSFLELASFIRKEIVGAKMSGLIEDINGVELYLNKEATYFAARIGEREITINLLPGNNDIQIKNISDDREYVLIMDAFEELYEKIHKKNNKEAIKHKKLVDKLFEKFLKRRKKTPVKEYIQLSKNNEKVYI